MFWNTVASPAIPRVHICVGMCLTSLDVRNAQPLTSTARHRRPAQRRAHKPGPAAHAGGLVVMDSEDHLPDLSTAMSALVRHLETAVGGMSPDDVVVELDCDRDGTKSSAHLRFRAYKHRSDS